VCQGALSHLLTPVPILAGVLFFWAIVLRLCWRAVWVGAWELYPWSTHHHTCILTLEYIPEAHTEDCLVAAQLTLFADT
jgi:hypothetical protein